MVDAGCHIEILRDSGVFGARDEEALLPIARVAAYRTLRTGDYLFHQGEPCSAMFLLVTGAIKLVQRSSGRRERVVELVRPGEWFAESAVFCGNGYHASACALSDTQVLGVPAVALGRFLRQRPGLAVALLHRLSRRAESAVQQMSDLCTRTAEQRVAAYLLEGYEGDGCAYNVPDGPHSRADLASLLAVTPETLSRILQRIRRLGLIEKVDKELLVRQPESLARMSLGQPPN